MDKRRVQLPFCPCSLAVSFDRLSVESPNLITWKFKLKLWSLRLNLKLSVRYMPVYTFHPNAPLLLNMNFLLVGQSHHNIVITPKRTWCPSGIQCEEKMYLRSWSDASPYQPGRQLESLSYSRQPKVLLGSIRAKTFAYASGFTAKKHIRVIAKTVCYLPLCHYCDHSCGHYWSIQP